ncbi:MAG: hypothetical protein QW035_02885 [Candidatus Anstonellales archaeon]
MMLMIWLNISIAIIATIFIASLLVYMIGKGFMIPQLESIAKKEMIYVVSTVLLLIFIELLVVELEGMLVAIMEPYITQLLAVYGQPAPSGQLTLIDMSIMFMGGPYNCLVTKILPPVAALASDLSTIFKAKVEVPMPNPSGFGGVGNILDLLNYFIGASVVFVLAYFFLTNLLLLFKHLSLPLFIPLGIILRAFSPTRGAGAYILAFSIVGYFVMPLTYSIISLILGISFGAAGICQPIDIPPYLLMTLNSGSPQTEAEQMAIRTLQSSGVMSNVADSIDKIIMGLFMYLCSIPFITLTVGLTTVLFLSAVFGINLPEVGRGLVKLI